jgi:hypothetical protein
MTDHDYSLLVNDWHNTGSVAMAMAVHVADMNGVTLPA